MRVLIVDDSSMVRRVVERSLRKSGMDVAEVIDAADGVEALAVLRQCEEQGAPLNLILTDICMPAMDGFEFVEQMRAENLMPGVPVVIVTSEHCMSDVRRAMAAGVSAYIRKPFTAEQVKATVLRLTQAA
ncbi:MAG: response regulator [Acidobacteriaceae bacterium]|jgi:two-component system chemotaxis response regulator CheY